MEQFKIIFSVKDKPEAHVVFSKDFNGLKDAFAWSDWYTSKHDWVKEYKIKPIFEKRRQKKR